MRNSAPRFPSLENTWIAPFIIIACLAAPASAAETSAPRGKPRIIAGNFPDQTDAAVDAKRGVHIVYGLAKKQQAFYRLYPDDSDAPTPAVLINGDIKITVGHERGPKVAIGPDTSVYVIWQSSDALHCARSKESGATAKFEPVKVLDAEAPIDVPNIGSDDRGNVYAIWVDHRHKTGDSLGAELFMARTDTVGRFGANTRISDVAWPVCPCCMPEIQCRGQRIFVLYRSSKDGVKEMVLRQADRREWKWTTAVISRDKWNYDGCPMSGGKLAASGDSIYATWMSDGKCFLSGSGDGGRTFFRPVHLESIRRLPLPTTEMLFTETARLNIQSLQPPPPRVSEAGPGRPTVCIGWSGSDRGQPVLIVRSNAEGPNH